MLPATIDFTSRVKRAGLTTTIALTVCGAVLVLPVVTGSNWPIITITTVIMIVINIIVLRIVNDGHMAKSALTATNIIIVFLVYANSSWVPGFNAVIHSLAAGINENYPLLAHLPPRIAHKLSVTAFGLSFVTLGINYPIAFILKTSGLTPSNLDTTEDAHLEKPTNEPARGKAIGYLERAIVLILMLSSNTAAIGFVLAAKAFARFKQLDERNFAEYVLIGTLMSFASTIAFGIAISAFM